jgi:DNA-binding transcriptional LysR family regulator
VNITAVNLNLLVALDALLVERHVTRAARRVGITQSAMSNALKQLRALYDDPLFVRRSRGMTPTPRALALQPTLREGLARLEKTFSPRAFDPTDKRTFVLAASDYVELVLLPPLLKAIAETGVRLEVRPWGRHEVPERLAGGEIDLAIGYFGNAPPGHHLQPLFEERFVGLIRQRHRAARARLSLNKWLELEHVVVSESSDRTSIDRALAAQGLSRTVGLRVSHFLLVPPLIASTDLVAAISERVAARFAKPLGLRVFPVPLMLPRSRVSMAFHDRFANDPGHVWLRRTIADVARRV